MLSNLLSNALKYTQAGGKVELSAEARGNEIVLRVADNGLGIPRDKWDQIFDRFSQLSDPNVTEIAGVGLGLYIVKKIVEGHGGAVWVDSAVGEGSEFFVSLPARAASAKPQEGPEAMAPARRVAVCDPDPELAATIAQALRSANFDVRVAHTGHRLLSHLHQGDVDVVVTDVLLPDMNASELLDALHNVSNRSFRTIVHSYDGDTQELRRRGVDIYLKRPISKNELVRAVQVALQKRSAAGMTVILVDDESIDAVRLKPLLANGGHMHLVAATWKEASSLARDYAADAIIIPSQSLAMSGTITKELRTTTANGTRVLVLCETLRRQERQWEDEAGITTVIYRPGREAEVVDAIMASQDALVAELGS